jgi:hypothetical protein
MSLTLPATTLAALEEIENAQQPTVDYEVSGKLSGLHQAEGLSEDERRGAWAEASAFNFRLMEESPWHTRYGPTFTATKNDGSPYYAPDIAEIDEEIINHWEQRSSVARHPLLRARYADVAWDLKKLVTGKQADIQLAQRAIDAYLDGITAKLYKDPQIIAVHAAQRALTLALSINDKNRIQQAKDVMLALFKENAQPGHIGVWATLYDALSDNKKVGLTPEEKDTLIQGLQHILDTAIIQGENQKFDPWSAEQAARRLAAHHEQQGKKEEAQKAIRAYGSAFEQLAAQANPMLAMTWLQPVHDEYKNRGMKDDAARVQAASAEKGKNIASDLKEVRTSVTITDEQMREFVEYMTQGSPHEALLRIAARFIPNTEKIKAFLQELLTTAPLMARIGVTRIVGDHFAAEAGSIEEDPEGRLIMQLAQNIQIENAFLHKSLAHLRTKTTLTADMILAVLDESPIFTPERRPLLREGIQAYLDGDHTKAIHVIIPQIEQALRQLLSLTGAATLKTGRNGMMQLKNLNDILREPTIKASLGEDLRLYLLTFLADERGQNVRNNISHGLVPPAQFNQGLSDQTLHAVLAVSLVRQKSQLPPNVDDAEPPSPPVE